VLSICTSVRVPLTDILDKGLGEAAGVLGWLGKGAREINFVGAASSSALSGNKKNEVAVQCGH